MSAPNNTTSSDLKRCSKCKEWKLRSEFHKAAKEKDGLKSRCKACIAVDSAIRYELHPEYFQDYYYSHHDKNLQYRQSWRNSHQEYIKDYRQKYQIANQQRLMEERRVYLALHREENKKRCKEYQNKHKATLLPQKREYYHANREKINQRRRETYPNHRIKNIKRSRAYYYGHWTEVREKRAAYYRNNKQIYRLASLRRRARKRGLPDTYTDVDFRHAKVYFNYRCAYCGEGPKEADFNWTLHQDHYIPITSSNCPGTVPWNMVPACQTCNLSKGYKLPSEWIPARFGKRKAKVVIARIESYFEKVQR